MTRYPMQELSFSELLKRSVRLHYLTLKHTIFCILFMTITKYACILLLGLFLNTYSQDVIYIVAALIMAYFFSAAMLATHNAFNDRPKPINDTLKEIWGRTLQIDTTFIFYVGGIFIVYYFSKLLLLIFDKLFHNLLSHPLSGSDNGIFISMIFTFVYLAMFYFSFPISVIDKKSAKKAFSESVLLTEKNKWGIFISFGIISITTLLITPGMIQEYFLSMYHLDVLFDFVVLCVAVPLYINLLLFLINDSRVQVKGRGV
ncbi:MAG: hypothetical protein NTU49_05130 [Gammaproteobacteria bacterium]|nr:hypothetical protein [Gammaproteobacteria bacterium]